jgi:hypothetical protein
LDVFGCRLGDERKEQRKKERYVTVLSRKEKEMKN